VPIGTADHKPLSVVVVYLLAPIRLTVTCHRTVACQVKASESIPSETDKDRSVNVAGARMARVTVSLFVSIKPNVAISGRAQRPNSGVNSVANELLAWLLLASADWPTMAQARQSLAQWPTKQWRNCPLG